MIKWATNRQVIIIVLLCLLSRLPQLLNPHLRIDGDECIEGLMAKHFSEGNGIPVFFYGQTYGFALIEVMLISLFYVFFGISDTAIKIAMLTLWTVGIVFFYKTLKQLNPEDRWTAFLITLVFIFSPSWFMWSLKARGGYLTAFALFPIITYLLFHKKHGQQLLAALLSGILTWLLFESQPLWLAGLIPVFVYKFYKSKIAYTVLFFSGSIVTAGIFMLLKSGITTFWAPQVLTMSTLSFTSIGAIPLQVFHHLTGSYYYFDIIKFGLATQLWAIAFTAIIFGTLVLGFIRLILRKAENPLFYVFCLSVLSTMCYVALISTETPRYLLPITGCALLMVYTAMSSYKKKSATNILAATFIILGGIVLSGMRYSTYEVSKKSELLDLIEALKSKNIHYVYCNGGLMQWEIMFYSKEQITARSLSNNDRYPKYIQLVDDALQRDSTKIAMVGDIGNTLVVSDAQLIDKRFFICFNPGRATLIEHGFDLGKIDGTKKPE
ncbi:MAG: hypothetical protein WCM76_09890 [Bacteroidota bacterium]